MTQLQRGFCALLLWASLAPHNARAQFDREARALQLITATANEICQATPLEQSGSNVELTADAKAKVGGVVGRVIGLGVEGAAKYDSESSRGVLRTDLAKAIADGNDCRRDVLRFLGDKLLAPAPPPPILTPVLPTQPAVAQSNPTTVGQIGIGSVKSDLEKDQRISFGSSNGTVYGTKTVTLTLGRGLAQTPVSFTAFYYLSGNAVYEIILQRTETTVCTSPNYTTTRLMLDDLIRKFGSVADGPLRTTAASSSPPMYDRIDTTTTKYMFSDAGFAAYLTETERDAQPRSSSLGNELSCRLVVDFRRS